jgi:hypothetical protein
LERFCFVNIDPDLYAPTKAGLQLFYPRMVNRGVILVHDYNILEGVTQAVDEFLEAAPNAIAVPIGDFMSLAIVKPNNDSQESEKSKNYAEYKV